MARKSIVFAVTVHGSRDGDALPAHASYVLHELPSAAGSKAKAKLIDYFNTGRHTYINPDPKAKNNRGLLHDVCS